jgi:hypothetical protein
VKKKFIFKLLFLLVALVSIYPQNSYATPQIKMVGLKPVAQIQLTDNPNDQVTTVLASPSSITVVGTSSNDGFITSFDKTATNVLWSLKLGGLQDDIATSAVSDAAGNYLVVGASSVDSPQVPTSAIPSGTLNPSGVLPDTSTALPQLKQLDVWRVSKIGVILKAYQLVMPTVIYPQSISVKGSKATITGAIASNPFDQFVTTLGSDGNFSPPKISSTNKVHTDVKELKTSLSLWKSFTTSVAIKGLPSWKPKPNSHVLIRYDLKSKAILAAYLTSGEIVDFTWEKSIGIISLINYPTGYSLAIVK